jgi:hypothetical protein
MLIILDKKIPQEAKEKLAVLDTLMELETDGIVYPAISGHPDIYICKTPEILVISPNLPEKYIQQLRDHGIKIMLGNKTSGISHPASIHYNATINDKYLIHRLEFTDSVILENCHTLTKIPVKQGYTRCNLMLLRGNHYITSDEGIHKSLQRHGLQGIIVSPNGIILEGFPNGFIGGTMGVKDNKVYIIGKLSSFPEGRPLRIFIENLGYSIVELYDGPLVDGGGILFL